MSDEYLDDLLSRYTKSSGTGATACWPRRVPAESPVVEPLGQVGHGGHHQEQRHSADVTAVVSAGVNSAHGLDLKTDSRAQIELNLKLDDWLIGPGGCQQTISIPRGQGMGLERIDWFEEIDWKHSRATFVARCRDFPANAFVRWPGAG